MAGQELPQLVAEGGLVPQLPVPLGLGLGLAQLCRERETEPGGWAAPLGRAGPAPRPAPGPGHSRRSSRSTLMLRQLRAGLRTSRAQAAAPPQAPPPPGRSLPGNVVLPPEASWELWSGWRPDGKGGERAAGGSAPPPDPQGREGAEPHPTLHPGPAAALGWGLLASARGLPLTSPARASPAHTCDLTWGTRREEMEGFRARDPGGLERCAESNPPLSRSLRNGREGSHSGVPFADANPQGLAGERGVDVFSKMNSAECFLLDAHALAPCGRGAPGPRPLNARPVSRLESQTPATPRRVRPWALGTEAAVQRPQRRARKGGWWMH